MLRLGFFADTSNKLLTFFVEDAMCTSSKRLQRLFSRSAGAKSVPRTAYFFCCISQVLGLISPSLLCFVILPVNHEFTHLGGLEPKSEDDWLAKKKFVRLVLEQLLPDR